MNEKPYKEAEPKGKTILLVRHGSLDLPEKIYLGQKDTPLSEYGYEQAKALGRWLRENNFFFEKVYTSPLIRCVKTCQGIAEGLQQDAKAEPKAMSSILVQKEDDLKEINLGTWDGKAIEEIKRQFPKEYETRGKELLTYKTPGGESFLELSQRALPCFLKIIEENKQLLIVAHAGVNRMILAHCMGNQQDFMKIEQEPACCYLMHKDLETNKFTISRLR